MFVELKRIEDLRVGELAQVTTPFYAVGALRDAQAGLISTSADSTPPGNPAPIPRRCCSPGAIPNPP
jgi:hypothetical protein